VLSLVRFQWTSDPWLAEQYRRLKYEVFVREGGWHLEHDAQAGEAWTDRHDSTSRFVGALDGRLLGILRASRPPLPHQDLLKHHFASGPPPVAGPIASLDSFAITRGARGLKLSWTDGIEAKISERIIDSMLAWLREDRIAVAFTSTGDVRARRRFASRGFLALDAMRDVDGMPLRVATFGIALDEATSRMEPGLEASRPASGTTWRQYIADRAATTAQYA